MNALINRVMQVRKQQNKATSQQPVECNYANNYYGDQVCMAKKRT